MKVDNPTDGQKYMIVLTIFTEDKNGELASYVSDMVVFTFRDSGKKAGDFEVEFSRVRV